MFLLLRWYARPTASSGFTVQGRGHALNKLTNVVILIPAQRGSADLVRTYRAGRPRAEWFRGLTLVLALSVPVGVWVARNKTVFGDWTGDSFKLRIQHWSLKQGGLFDHPLTTPGGQYFFWTSLIPSFWYGDVSWRTARIPPLWIRAVSIGLSPVLVLAGAVRSAVRPASVLELPLALAVSFLVVAFAVLSLVVVSMIFDFSKVSFPSRDYPYLFCGRLLLGTLVPFLALLVTGIDAISFGRPLVWHVLFGIVCLTEAVDQYSMLRLMLPSSFNWFHLPH